jgi:hypothetical protein
MSCKRCRRRNRICTISPHIDHPSAQRSRRGNSRATTKAQPDSSREPTNEMNAPMHTVEQWSTTFPEAIESEAWGPMRPPEGTPAQIELTPGDGIDPGLFSGLVTRSPPSSASDTDRESESHYRLSLRQPGLQGHVNGLCPAEYKTEDLNYVDYYENGMTGVGMSRSISRCKAIKTGVLTVCAGETSHQENRLGNEEYCFGSTWYQTHSSTERLLDLHSFLLKESKHLASRATEDFQCSLSTSHQVDDVHGNSADLDTAVHTALSVSEQFLDILKHFQLNEQPDLQPVPLHIATNLSRTVRQEAFYGTNGQSVQELVTPLDMLSMTSGFEDYGLLHGANSLGQDLKDQHIGLSLNERQVAPDMPTALTLIGCYVCLIQIYHAIFTRVLESLMACMPINGHVNSSMPGLSPSGPPTSSIDTHRKLQLQMLVRVSTHMLALIEEQLGLSEHGYVEKSGVLDNLSMGLLDSLSKYEDAALGNSRESMKQSLQWTIETINQLLELS